MHHPLREVSVSVRRLGRVHGVSTDARETWTDGARGDADRREVGRLEVLDLFRRWFRFRLLRWS